MKKILVIGADGTIGSSLVEKLKSLNHTVISTTRQIDTTNAERIYLDLSSDIVDWIPPSSIDVVYFCAAQTSVSYCENHKTESKKINVENTLILIDILTRVSKKIVFLSTSLVFNGKTPLVKPIDDYEPQCEYARQKVDVEKALLALGRDDVIVRITKVLHEKNPLFNQWITDLNKEQVINPFDDFRMAPISLDYLIKILVLFLDHTAQKIYQLSGDRDITYLQAAQYLANILDKDSDLIKPISSQSLNDVNSYNPQYTTLDSTRLLDEYNVNPQNVWAAISEVFKK